MERCLAAAMHVAILKLSLVSSKEKMTKVLTDTNFEVIYLLPDE